MKQDNETIYGYLLRTSKFIGKTYGDTYENIAAVRIKLGYDVNVGSMTGHSISYQ